jgi:hypothetical protein
LWKIPLGLLFKKKLNHQWERPPPEGAEPPPERPADDIPDDALTLLPPPLLPPPLKPPDELALDELPPEEGGDPRWTETGAALPILVDRPAVALDSGLLRYTGVLAVPRCTACSENPLSLPSPSRGTPMPAESLRNSNSPPEPISDRTKGLVFTTVIVGAPLTGG